MVANFQLLEIISEGEDITNGDKNVVYLYKCDLCDADYVGFTSRHLHQRGGTQTLSNRQPYERATWEGAK